MSSYTLKAPNITVKTGMDCGWLILVEPSYVIQMQGVSYTESPKCSSNTTNCICNSVQVTIIYLINFLNIVNVFTMLLFKNNK